LEETENLEYKQSSQSIHQVSNLQTDPNYQLASSSGVDKLIQDFDLNQIPPVEDQ